MEGKREWRGGGRTSIAGEALLPTEPPMRAFGSRHHRAVPSGSRFRGCGRFHHERFGSDDFEPGAPDLATWPVVHQDRGSRKGRLRRRQRSRWSVVRGKGPEDGTDSAWLP